MPRVKRYEVAAPTLEADLLDAIERDRHAARALDLEAAQRIQDIRRQAAAAQGFDAETAAADARKAIAEARAELVGRATSPRMRAMLEDVLERRASLVDDELTAHTKRARTAALLDAALQRRRLAQEEAADAITPHAFDIHHQTMLDAIDEHGQLVGLDPAEIAANRQRASSAVHAGRTAARLDAGDIDGAIAWRDANRDAFSAVDLARIEALLAEPAARAAAAARVDRVMGARPRDGDSPFSYADPLHGAGRTPVAIDGQGVLLPAVAGTPAYPTGPGVVRFGDAGDILVTHADGSQSRYAGLSDLRPEDGDRVTPDSLLGIVAAGETPALRYAVLRGGAPLEPDEILSRLGGGADMDAVLRELGLGTDYASGDRIRDEDEVRRRMSAFEGMSPLDLDLDGVEAMDGTPPRPKARPTPQGRKEPGWGGSYLTPPAKRGWLSEVDRLAPADVPYPIAPQPDISRAGLEKLRKKLGYFYGLPEVKALMDVIAWAEGAEPKIRGRPSHSLPSADGYKTSHGMRDPLRDEDLAGFRGEEALGRYQILPVNYKTYAKRHGRTDFGPITQDIIALELMNRSGVFEALMNGDFDGAIYAAAKEWASFPKSPTENESGFGKDGTPYPPGTKTVDPQRSFPIDKLREIFAKRVRSRRQEFEQARRQWEARRDRSAIPYAFISPFRWRSFGNNDF